MSKSDIPNPGLRNMEFRIKQLQDHLGPLTNYSSDNWSDTKYGWNTRWLFEYLYVLKEDYYGDKTLTRSIFFTMEESAKDDKKKSKKQKVKNKRKKEKKSNKTDYKSIFKKMGLFFG